MRLRWPALLVSLAACASNGQVARMEARITAVEASQAERDLKLRTALARLEAVVGQLDGKIDDGAEQLDELDDRVDGLATRVDQLGKQPTVMRAQRPTPDPTMTYAVPIAGSPVRGGATALVTIVRAGEYACPFCAKVRTTLDQIAKHYGNDVRIVYKHFVVHPQTANGAAHAACAAHRQGKFWEMDELLWDNTFAKREFDAAKIEALAASLGLDMTTYRVDLVGACPKIVQAEMAEMTKVGVGATPAFFVNGRFLSGAQPFPAFQALIDEELAKAKAAVKQGTKRAAYYDQFVIKKGLPSLQPKP